jgi:hypothetical protein
MTASAGPGSAAAGPLKELAAEIAADRNALLEIEAVRKPSASSPTTAC